MSKIYLIHDRLVRHINVGIQNRVLGERQRASLQYEWHVGELVTGQFLRGVLEAGAHLDQPGQVVFIVVSEVRNLQRTGHRRPHGLRASTRFSVINCLSFYA